MTAEKISAGESAKSERSGAAHKAPDKGKKAVRGQWRQNEKAQEIPDNKMVVSSCDKLTRSR